jgi:hypothetical protein
MSKGINGSLLPEAQVMQCQARVTDIGWSTCEGLVTGSHDAPKQCTDGGSKRLEAVAACGAPDTHLPRREIVINTHLFGQPWE